MITLRILRINLYKIIDMMIKTGTSFYIVRDRKVYEMRLFLTPLTPRNKYTPRFAQRKKALNPHSFVYEGCDYCGELTVNKVCLNAKCESNKNYVERKKGEKVPKRS
jgi:hypothetical protein